MSRDIGLNIYEQSCHYESALLAMIATSIVNTTNEPFLPSTPAHDRRTPIMWVSVIVTYNITRYIHILEISYLSLRYHSRTIILSSDTAPCDLISTP